MSTPAVCDPGCLKCSSSDPSTCIECLNGFSLSTSGVCTPCNFKCKTCSTTPSTCTSCYANAFYSSSNCLLCDSNSNCQACLSSNKT